MQVPVPQATVMDLSCYHSQRHVGTPCSSPLAQAHAGMLASQAVPTGVSLAHTPLMFVTQATAAPRPFIHPPIGEHPQLGSRKESKRQTSPKPPNESTIIFRNIPSSSKNTRLVSLLPKITYPPTWRATRRRNKVYDRWSSDTHFSLDTPSSPPNVASRWRNSGGPSTSKCSCVR